jgi:septum formation protein
MSAGHFILASASPRRQELLRQAGYVFDIVPADLDEAALSKDLGPSDTARALALAKAEAIAPKFPDELVLAADTIVSFGEMVLGKAADANDARKMLRLLAGTTHLVITGVAAIRIADNFNRVTRITTAVHMKMMTHKQIDEYVATNIWQGKAGSYGIQDKDPFCIRLSGCDTNIVGLPMTTTRAILREAGIVPEATAT